MFVVGFATEDEITILKREEWEVEDATKFGKVVDTVDGSLMLPPEPSPSNTRAVAVFVDASVYDVLRPRNSMAGDSVLDLEYKTKRLNALEQHPPQETTRTEPTISKDGAPGCCAEGDRLLRELDNDQNADPGYRHIRLEVQARGFNFSTRARFCPWCGTEFKVG